MLPVSLKHIERLNRRFEYEPALENAGNELFRVIPHGSPLMLSAQHATCHYSGKYNGTGKRGLCCKFPDPNTGGLVRYIAHTERVSVMYRCRMGTEGEHYTYEEHLLQLRPGLLLDIHCMRTSPDFDVAIGTGIVRPTEYRRELSIIGGCLKAAGLKMALNPKRYNGGRLTRQLQHAQVRAIQIELSADCLLGNNILQRLNTLAFMTQLVRKLKNG